MTIELEQNDKTLEAIDVEIEREQSPYVSNNIGFGLIGHCCERHIWYKINSKEAETFSAKTLRIFRNGHRDEDAMAEDLRKVKGIELYTHDPDRDNKQYKFDALDGRLTGRLDGVIVGLKHDPKTPYVWEHKSVNDKKFNEIVRVPILKAWDMTYYAQAQCNMYHSELDKHYMTISTPGLRQVTSVITALDKGYAEALVGRARRIIKAKSPPEKIGGSDWYQCKFCRFHNECHSS